MLLLFFFRESLDKTRDRLSAAILESGNDVAHRSLEEGDDVSDEFFLGLDSAEFLELVSSDESALLDVRALELRLLAEILLELLDELGRSVGRFAEHDGRVAFEKRENVLKLLVLNAFDDMGEQGVLHDVEFDTLVEAGAAEFDGVLSIQSLNVGEVEVRILLELR